MTQPLVLNCDVTSLCVYYYYMNLEISFADVPLALHLNVQPISFIMCVYYCKMF